MKVDMNDPLTRAAAEKLARMTAPQRDELWARVRAGRQQAVEALIKGLGHSETGGSSRQ